MTNYRRVLTFLPLAVAVILLATTNAYSESILVEQIKRNMDLSPELEEKGFDVELEEENGEISVDGVADSNQTKQLIFKLTMDVPGVKRIRDGVAIEPSKFIKPTDNVTGPIKTGPPIAENKIVSEPLNSQ